MDLINNTVYNDIVLKYARTHKNIVCVPLPNNNSLIVHINVFALITGFELTVNEESKFVECIQRDDNGSLVIRQAKCKEAKTFNHTFEPFFNYRNSYTVGECNVSFNLSAEYADNLLVANVITDKEDLEPIIIHKKYETIKSARSYYMNDLYDYYDDKSLVTIVITFNGRIVSLT